MLTQTRTKVYYVLSWNYPSLIILLVDEFDSLIDDVGNLSSSPYLSNNYHLQGIASKIEPSV